MTPKHPYIGLPDRALWSRGVARRFAAEDVVTADVPLLQPGERVASIGSCFASNIIPYIERAGLTYLRTEEPPEQVQMLPENLGYRDFSAAYGNVYTARQMRQLIDRATGRFQPEEDRWQEAGRVIDPFRPGLAYPATSDFEFDIITASHLAATRQAFELADVVVITLGLTEGWESAADGAVFPTCPGTVGGSFDAGRHAFRNFTVGEITDDLQAFIDVVRDLNGSSRFIVTVSPVPLVATASGQHVLAATTYSKSVLRVAANEITESNTSVSYFPAYELVTGPQAPGSFFEKDRRSVSREAIDQVMETLISCSGLSTAKNIDGPTTADLTSSRKISATEVGARLAQAECDEVMLDPAGQSTQDPDEGTDAPA